MTELGVSGEDRVAAVTAATERTLAAASARVSLKREFSFEMPDHSTELTYSPLWLKATFAAGGLSARAIKLLWKLTMGNRPLSPQIGDGFIDPAGLRYMLDFGSYAELFTDGDLFAGRSGRSVHTLTPWSPDSKNPDILWLILLLRGTVGVGVAGSTDIRGTQCTEFAVQADLARASQQTDFPLQAPQRRDFKDLHRLSITVWTDDRYLRRIEYREDRDRMKSKMTIDLWDYRTDISDLNWTRLPDTATQG